MKPNSDHAKMESEVEEIMEKHEVPPMKWDLICDYDVVISYAFMTKDLKKDLNDFFKKNKLEQKMFFTEEENK